jgi:eukaryotic-like serine/threonine-protein kinase
MATTTLRAALKLLRGWSGTDASARFTRERQILANLDHPHIARLLDGGTTPRGRPYLVMELVEGQSIDAHCQARALGLRERLDLFDTVCSAVAHAHRHLVIHCDIKPDNVRVSTDGQAKLLDFGIAQLQGQADELGAAFTPGFASPEQMAGQRPGVASDVYGLGCLLQDDAASRVARQTAPPRTARHGGLRDRHQRASGTAAWTRCATICRSG